MLGHPVTHPCANCGDRTAERRGSVWLCRTCFEVERQRAIRFLVLLGTPADEDVPELEMRALYGDR